MPGVAARRRLEGARAPGRGGARRRAHHRLLATRTRVDARVLRLERELAAMTDSRGWRMTAPLRCCNSAAALGASARLVAERPRGSRPSRSPAPPVRDAGSHPQPREPLGDRERARLEHPPQHAPPASTPLAQAAHSSHSAAPAPAARWWTRLASSRSSTGLRSQRSRIARDGARPGRALVPERRRSRRTPARRRAAARSRPATKSSIAVSTPLRAPPSRAAERAYGRPPGRRPRLAGDDAARRARERLPVLGGDQLGREVVVAAPVRPARRRGTAAAAARRPARALAISRSSSLTVK